MEYVIVMWNIPALTVPMFSLHYNYRQTHIVAPQLCLCH